MAPPLLGGSTAANQGIKSLTTFAKQLIGFGSLAYVLKSLISSVVSMTKTSLGASFGLDRFTAQTMLSREELKRWELAAAAQGVSSEEIQDQLGKIAIQAANARRFGFDGPAAAASWFGLNPLGSSQDYLRKFGAQVQGMALADAQVLGEKMNISPKVAYMLWSNGGRIPESSGGLALNTAEQDARMRAAKALNEVGVAAASLRDHFVSFEIQLGIIVKPLEKLTEAMRGWGLILEYSGLIRKRIAPTPGEFLASADARIKANLDARAAQRATTTNNVTTHINVDGNINDKSTLQRVFDGAYFQAPQQLAGPAPQAQ
jgi:hypothetical protein